MDDRAIRRALSRLDNAAVGDLAALLYARGDAKLLEKLQAAVLTAADLLAYYPHDVVVEEADALLYQTLRSPVFDALPPGAELPDPGCVAVRLSLSEAEASALMARIDESECDAAKQLVASGVNPNWTIEQQQVMRCITELVDRGVAPTRARVIEAAIEHAATAMPRWSTEPPVVEACEPGSSCRINSPSPMAQVPVWMARMDAKPPNVQLPEDRICYLVEAKEAAGRASRIAQGEVREPLSAHARRLDSVVLGLSA